jgi:hypothetical protein
MNDISLNQSNNMKPLRGFGGEQNNTASIDMISLREKGTFSMSKNKIIARRACISIETNASNSHQNAVGVSYK